MLELCKKHLPEDFLANTPLLNKALITVEDKILKNPEGIKDNISCFFAAKEYDKELLLNQKMKVDEQVAKTAIEETLKSLDSFEDYENIEAIQQYLLEVIDQVLFVQFCDIDFFVFREFFKFANVYNLIVNPVDVIKSF